MDDLISRDKVLAAIKNKLTANGIDLPFPTQQILFHDQTEETDGDRSNQREGWPAGNKQAPKTRRISDSLKQLAQTRASRNDGNGNHKQPQTSNE
jgi:small conductance mechanosensitive channel